MSFKFRNKPIDYSAPALAPVPEPPDLNDEPDPCLVAYLDDLLAAYSWKMEPFHHQFSLDVSQRGIWSDKQRALALDILGQYWHQAGLRKR